VSKTLAISQVLQTPIVSDDLDGTRTLREYLTHLLLTLWREEEGFNGKRPFGNSGWQWDVYRCLIKAGAIKGSLDSDGFIEHFNEVEGRELMLRAIQAMGRGQ